MKSKNDSLEDVAWRWHRRVLLLALVSVVVSCMSCGDSEDEEKLQDVPATANAVVKRRAEKDKFFKYDSSSPLPQQMRASFTGLSYYNYDDKYAVIASFEAASKLDTLRMPVSHGESRAMIRAGVFSFSIGDDEKVYTLNGYRSADNSSKSITIPFKDKTTGSTTYEAGRYVEVEDSGDECTIDFNEAYSPYCAYNDTYSCLLIPPQNVLNISIAAGEKIYQPHVKGQRK